MITFFLVYIESAYCFFNNNQQTLSLISKDSAILAALFQERLIMITADTNTHVRRIHIRRRRSRRAELKVSDVKKYGRTTYFKLCVLMKNGKCIRKKRFGMWNTAKGPES